MLNKIMKSGLPRFLVFMILFNMILSTVFNEGFGLLPIASSN